MGASDSSPCTQRRIGSFRACRAGISWRRILLRVMGVAKSSQKSQVVSSLLPELGNPRCRAAARQPGTTWETWQPESRLTGITAKSIDAGILMELFVLYGHLLWCLRYAPAGDVRHCGGSLGVGLDKQRALAASGPVLLGQSSRPAPEKLRGAPVRRACLLKRPELRASRSADTGIFHCHWQPRKSQPR